MSTPDDSSESSDENSSEDDDPGKFLQEQPIINQLSEKWKQRKPHQKHPNSLTVLHYLVQINFLVNNVALPPATGGCSASVFCLGGPLILGHMEVCRSVDACKGKFYDVFKGTDQV